MDPQDPAPSAPSTFGPLVWGWPCQPIVSQSHSSQTDEAPGSSEGLALDYNVVLGELGRVREQRDSTLAKLGEMARDRSNYDRHIQELDGMLRRQMDEAAAESRRVKQMVVCAFLTRTYICMLTYVGLQDMLTLSVEQLKEERTRLRRQLYAVFCTGREGHSEGKWSHCILALLSPCASSTTASA